MSYFETHKEILPPEQLTLMPELIGATRLGYVLYGGTAIALRWGHRISEDFDFFNDAHLDKQALFEALPFMDHADVLQDRPNTLTIQVAVSRDAYVKVSFFGAIGFGRVGEPQTTADGILQVASPDDLMANKVKVILQRVSAKDYIDIGAMVEAGVSLDRGLAAARLMFGHVFQPAESLRAMTYFEGGDLHLLTDQARRTLIQAASAVRRLPEIELLSQALAKGAETRGTGAEPDKDKPEESGGFRF
jgi:hypothetical protein